MDKPVPVIPDLWQRLRQLTPARIALGRTGASLPTQEILRFGLAHAQARDAVHEPLDVPRLQAELAGCGFASVAVRSRATDRAAYLRQPDCGRRLDVADAGGLSRGRPAKPSLAFVIADGLSAVAVQRHSVPLLLALEPYIAEVRTFPVVIATQGRVALGDEIGELLGVEQVAVLIGERPGLSSPDSLGIYLTYAPKVGRTDAERNCLSNVRPQGLDYDGAARKLAGLMAGARRLGRTGVDLKDESDAALSGHTVRTLPDEP